MYEIRVSILYDESISPILYSCDRLSCDEKEISNRFDDHVECIYSELSNDYYNLRGLSISISLFIISEGRFPILVREKIMTKYPESIEISMSDWNTI